MVVVHNAGEENMQPQVYQPFEPFDPGEYDAVVNKHYTSILEDLFKRGFSSLEGNIKSAMADALDWQRDREEYDKFLEQKKKKKKAAVKKVVKKTTVKKKKVKKKKK